MESSWHVILHIILLSMFSHVKAVSRDDFPAGFIFGAGTSAYQVEGAAAHDGRTPSIWDTFTHNGAAADKTTGDIAADQYHKYKEDVKLMHEMGLDAYRFSISWSRLIPNGRGSVNQEGLRYYNNLIDELKKYGIEPHVTLYHLDLPQALYDDYGGLLSLKIIEDFTYYSNVCFHEFGDRVKHWSTFNEPNIETVFGYNVGLFAPGHCSYPFGKNCSKGNSSTEPYIVAHNILLSHAASVSLYRKHYQAKQGGYIGLTLAGFWYEPLTDSLEDIAATKRAQVFHLGWFMEPLIYGSYPAVMRNNVGTRLPSFRKDESDMLKGSYDFIGITHYSVFYVEDDSSNKTNRPEEYYHDMLAKVSNSDAPIAAPWAIKKLLEQIRAVYCNPPVFIHENGYGEYNLNIASGQGTNDQHRAEFIQQYIDNVLLAIRKGSNAVGYFVWSFVDTFELAFGYTARFGLYGVDFTTENRTRYPRYSVKWYSNFLQSNDVRSTASSDVYME